MPLFAIYCTDKPNHQAVRQDTRPAHLEYVAQWAGQILLGGPMTTEDGAMVGSLLVMDFADEAAAQAFAEGDPYAKAGLFESVRIRRFKAVLGSAAPQD